LQNHKDDTNQYYIKEEKEAIFILLDHCKEENNLIQIVVYNKIRIHQFYNGNILERYDFVNNKNNHNKNDRAFDHRKKLPLSEGYLSAEYNLFINI